MSGSFNKFLIKMNINIDELRTKSEEERKLFIFNLASEIGIYVTFSELDITNSINFDEQLFNLDLCMVSEEQQQVEQQVEQEEDKEVSTINENSLSLTTSTFGRCNSTLPISTSGSSPDVVSDIEFSNFLRGHQDINMNVLRHNSSNVRRMRKNTDRLKDSTKYLKRTSTLDSIGKYGCKLCGQVHFMSSLQKRKSVKTHEPMLYIVRNFLLRYDVAPDVTWRKTFMNGDESYELDMLERFFSILLPEHENDQQWSYLIRKRSYETRNCFWSSSEGDLRELTKRNMLDLFVQPYRILHPVEIRKSPTIERNIISRRAFEEERAISSVMMTSSYGNGNNNNSSSTTTNLSDVTMATMFYDLEEFEALDLKRKRAE